MTLQPLGLILKNVADIIRNNHDINDDSVDNEMKMNDEMSQNGSNEAKDDTKSEIKSDDIDELLINKIKKFRTEKTLLI